jgi:hypothetical protein
MIQHNYLKAVLFVIQKYWVLGLRPLSGILETRKQRFGNWICFCLQVRGGGDTYSVGPLERANLKSCHIHYSYIIGKFAIKIVIKSTHSCN